MSAIHEFDSSWPLENWGSTTVIAAVSGGPDSVALVRLMVASQKLSHAEGQPTGNIVIAHFDHAMRPDSSNDARFVENLAAKLDLSFERGCSGTKLTSEQAARTSRYEFLEQVAARAGARYIATGHTADDQAETILHHVIRGTGLAGLSGMPRTRTLNRSVTLIRPLLRLRRDSLRAYLEQIGQSFIVDPTNDDSCFTRNRIRNELIPHLASYNADIVSALNRLGELSAASEKELNSLVDEIADQCVVFSESDQVTIDASELGNTSKHLIRLLGMTIWRRKSWPRQEMSFRKWDALADCLLDEKQRPFELPGGIRVERTGHRVLLSR